MFNLFIKKNVQNQKFQQHFVNYIRYTEDGKAVSIIVDLGLKSIAPDKNFPYCLLIKIAYDVCYNEHGLPTNEQRQQLNDWEDRIVKIAENHFPYYNFAAVTQDGFRIVAFYCPSKSSKESFEEEVKKSFGTQAAQLYFQYFKDENWEVYLKDMYPKPFQLQEIKNQSVVQQLKENGDQSDVARPIRHFVYFPENFKEQVKNYKTWIAENGFQILSEVVAEQNNLLLKFSRNDCPNFYVINDVCLPLWDYAQQLGGVYDGWETQIIEKETL